MQLHADYSQTMMFPPTLEDLLPAEHPARFIREFVDALDLKHLGFKMRESAEGGSYYDPSLLLKVWLFGYFQRIRSSRKVEAACREMIGAMWLAGMLTPDHNTLWRFWSANRAAVRRLFSSMVKSAAQAGEIGFTLHALDGTKILARSSRRAAWHREELEEQLEKLDGELVGLEAQIESAGAAGEESYALVRTVAERRRQIASALAELDRSDCERMQPAEPEVQMIGAPSQWAYNCQAVVDDKSGMIVAADVTTDAHDAHQLRPMLDEVKDNVGRTAEVTVVDSAYGKSGEELARCADATVVSARPSNEAEPFHRSKFQLDREANTLVCPQDHQLTYVSSTHYRYGQGQVLRFRCTAHATCPFVTQCMGKRKTKIVEISPYHETVIAQQQIVEPVTRKALLARRRHIAEVPFARIKENGAFRRFSFRGLFSTKAQWAMICLVENLRLLWKRKITPKISPSAPSKRQKSLLQPIWKLAANFLSRWLPPPFPPTVKNSHLTLCA